MTTPRIPFFDASRDARAHADEYREAFDRVLLSGRYILGPEVEAFEQEAAAYLGAPYAVAVSSGTDALLITLMALGIGHGDEVIVPAFGFVATAEVVVRAGASVVFADIDPLTLCIDPEDVARKVTVKTRAVIPVHIFGRQANVGGCVIEDSAQSFTHGKYSVASCHSFFPTKQLGGFGDGGMLTTRHRDLYHAAIQLRQHGMTARDEFECVGGNFRLDALQAALLRCKLKRIDEAITKRARTGLAYQHYLASVPGLTLPNPGTFNQFVIRVHDGKRDALKAHFSALGIETAIYYSRPLHLQRCFPGGFRGQCPEAERACEEVLALPIYPELTDDEVARVIEGVRGFFKVAVNITKRYFGEGTEAV